EGVYMDAEAELAERHPLERTAEQHAQMQLYLRYKTTAERSFYRAYYAMRGLRKDKLKEELDLSKLREEVQRCAREAVQQASKELQQEKAETMRAIKKPVAAEMRTFSDRAQRAPTALCARPLFQGQNAPKKMRKVGVLDQWIEVEIQDGRTVTKLYPSNAGLIKEGQAMDPPPDLVYRRLNFPHGVPEEYRWAAGSNAARFERGGMGTQRMTVETWLDVIEREEARGTGHVGPTGVGNLPRPKERGGCDCEVCTHNREAMERRVG
ncbi:MAG TPA: hypothetical protein VHU83_08075, partial [Bryobacteraceae bacterium]|nr:hypothetical protein [Bryobacteraceae bacterium]